MAVNRTIVDPNQDVFRYGLHKYRDSKYEDPTYLGFTIELDENSALFTQVLPFLERRSANNWTELQSRIPVYKQFVDKIRQVFNSQESVTDEFDKTRFIKQHYINTISGLDNLKKKFNLYREDVLGFELHEDIAMWSSYLSYLYNNLTYSYENGRELIPENLLKFNMHIKISEIRSLTSIGKFNSTDERDQRIANALKNNVTSIIYKLYDCQFNFFNASPIEDEINQSGIDTPTLAHSIVNFEVFFKSVSRQIYNPLIQNSLAMNDNKINLDVIVVNESGDANPTGQVTGDSAEALGENGEKFQKQQSDSISVFNQDAFTANNKKPSSLSSYESETSTNPNNAVENDISKRLEEINDIRLYNEPLAPEPRDRLVSPDGDVNDLVDGNQRPSFLEDPQQKISQLSNKIASKVDNTLNIQKQRAINKIKQKRNELVRTFIYDVTDTVGLKRIVPDNVYETSTIASTVVNQLVADVGLTTADELVNILTNN